MKVQRTVLASPDSATSLSPLGPRGPVAPAAAGGGSFRQVLAEVLSGSAEAERRLGEKLARLGRGHSSPEELIAVQAAVYRSTRDFELLSKLVDKSTGAVRQALQSGQGG